MAPARVTQGRPGAPALSFSGCDRLSLLADEWDQLCRRLDAPPFLRPGFFAAWWEAFGSGSPELLVARRGERLVGALPLMREAEALVSPTNWHSPGFAAVAEDGAVEAGLLAEARRRAGTRLDLGFLSGAAAERVAAAAVGAGWQVIARTVEQVARIEVDPDRQAFERRLPAPRRTELERGLGRLTQAGSWEFERHDGGERLAELLAEGFELEAAGWRRGTAVPVVADLAARGFYRRLAEWAAEQDRLWLCFLRLDGRAIAFAYCLAGPQTLYVHKVGRDPSCADCRPGLVLARETIAAAAEAGLGGYEYLGDHDPAKLLWAERLLDRRRVQAFPRGPSGVARYLAWRYGRPLAKRALRR